MVDEGARNDGVSQPAPEREAQHVEVAAARDPPVSKQSAAAPNRSSADIPVQRIVPLMQVRLCNNIHELPHAPGGTWMACPARRGAAP